MKFFIQKTTSIWILLLVFNSITFTTDVKAAKNFKNINLNGKEIKLSSLPNLQIPFQKGFNARGVLQETTSKAYKLKVVEPDFYLLDSMTQKDITLSTESDIVFAYTFKYDNQGRVVSEISKKYTSPVTFIVDSKSIFHYGENYVLEFNYSYDDEHINFALVKSSFDSSGRLIMENFGSDSLNLNRFYTTTLYNYENNLLKTVETKNGNSFPSSKTIYYYDSEQKLDSLIKYTNKGLDSLIYSLKAEFKYDNSNNLLREEFFNWNKEWKSYSSQDYTYTSDNDCIEMVSNQLMAEYYDKIVYKFEYNTNVNDSNIFSGERFSDFSFKFKHQMTRIIGQILNNEEILQAVQVDLHYSLKQTTGTVNMPGYSGYKLTFNKSNNSFTISNLKEFENSNINFYDSTGKLIQKSKINSNNFNISGIKNGIYFYRLTVNGNSFSGKILID